MVEIHLHVKFRIFHKDIANFDKVFPLPDFLQIVPNGIVPDNHVFMNDHGILLETKKVGVSPTAVA